MSDIVQKLWGFCHTLRHDGVDYGDYIEQLTYLLFLKMADERAAAVPKKYDWNSLKNRAGTDLTDHYAGILRKLRESGGLLADIFAQATPRFNNPVNLKRVIAMIDEERLAYVGSIVLGLNDALVELTGTLAGLTFALQRGSIVAISGIITGIAAAFSMAASDYLASKAEGDPRAKKSAIYTGAAYLVTVVLLVLPYLLLPQRGGWIYLSLAITLLIAIGIIAGFNYYLAVAKDQNFKTKFAEMAVISLGVAAFSFVVGLIVRAAFGVDI